MYIAKIYCDKRLIGVTHYHKFENAVAEIGNKRMCSDMLSDAEYDKFSNCKIESIICASESNGVSDDFEFRCSDGICIYVGTIYFEDEER